MGLPPVSSTERSTRRPGGLAQAGASEFSVAEAVGGKRGVVEAVLPSVVFVAVYSAVQELRPAVIAAVAVAGLATLSRLVRREKLTQALSGLVGVGVAAFFANRSGQAEDFFLPGLYINIAYSIGYTVSILVRLPLIGLLLGPLLGEGLAWRKDRARLSAYQKATWIWVVLFLARLAVQGPLYLAGMVGALGTARVFMGVPLFALAAYLSWLVLRAVPRTVRTEPEAQPQD